MKYHSSDLQKHPLLSYFLSHCSYIVKIAILNRHTGQTQEFYYRGMNVGCKQKIGLCTVNGPPFFANPRAKELSRTPYCRPKSWTPEFNSRKASILIM